MVLHATSAYNRHVCNDDGLTPFEVIHGQRLRAQLVEFGEQVWAKPLRQKTIRKKISLATRWVKGTWGGLTGRSAEILTEGGSYQSSHTHQIAGGGKVE